MNRALGSRLARLEIRNPAVGGLVVFSMRQGEDRAKHECELTASGAALARDTFLCVLRLTEVAEGFTPYRIAGGMGELLRIVAERGQRIFDPPRERTASWRSTGL
jgi:hypothetical protein